MSSRITCAFTGHRPSSFSFGYDEENANCQKLKLLMASQTMLLIENGVSTFFTGMALGVDTWGAEIILEFKKQRPDLQLIAVLPCETQADKWSAEQRERYFDMLPECDDVITLNSHYTPECMLERNRYMVDHATYILAVYNGSGKGGTAYTIRYAREKKREIIVIHPDAMEIVSPVNLEALERRNQLRILPGKQEVKSRKSGGDIDAELPAKTWDPAVLLSLPAIDPAWYNHDVSFRGVNQMGPRGYSVEIKIVKEDKKQFLDLLLLADESESMIDKYLERGELFALYDHELRSVCVVTEESPDTCELKNIATYEKWHGMGYGSKLIQYIGAFYKDKYKTMIVGTGDVPSMLGFYGKNGFYLSHRIHNFFTDNYDHPMFENGVQLVDMIYLKKEL